MSALAEDPTKELFASSSVAEHVVRGLVGLVLAVGSFALAPAHPWALLGLVAAAVAWRGCPTCWALGLSQTLSRGRVGCADGTCAGGRGEKSSPMVTTEHRQDGGRVRS